MGLIYVTRTIPQEGIALLKDAGHQVDCSEYNRILTKEELIHALSQKPYDAILSLLTDRIDAEVLDAAPSVKIVANYAAGFNNVDLAAARDRHVWVTNTPVVSNNAVAEHTIGMLLALTARLVEGDRFMREGKYVGWDPLLFLGDDMHGKTLGLIGAGGIGSRVAHIAYHGLGMEVLYNDVERSALLDADMHATYTSSVEEVLEKADVVSLHVPLLPATQHLLNAERLKRMKPTAYLINTSRGPVIDEAALVQALTDGVIKGAALDVYENEPVLAPGLASLPNVLLTPHIASATIGTRHEMALIVARNIIAVLAGKDPETPAAEG